MNNYQLEQIINQQLNSEQFKDYAPNGLQVEGRAEVNRIITGVTACQALLDKAVEMQADAVIVHHGYFWKNELLVIKNMKRQRLKTLLSHDINLYGWHLPLDAHPTLGNNACLAADIDLQLQGQIDAYLPWGILNSPMTGEGLVIKLAQALNHSPLHCGDNGPELIKRVALCTGGGQDYIERAADFGVDAFITGEVSEKTIHIARERGIHFFAAGHHATERGGVKALGAWLQENHALEVTFVDIMNPV